MSVLVRSGPAGRPRGWIRRLLPFLAVYRRQAVLTFAAALTGLAVTALTPVIQKVIVDDVILARRRPLGLWLGILVAAGLFRFGAAHLRRYLGGIVALGVEYDLRNEIHARLQRLDFARHDQFHTGQLVSRAISDVSLVQGLLAFFPLVSGNVLLLVLSICVMTVLSPLLTVVALLVVPLVTVIALRLRTTVFPAAWDAQQKAAEVAGVVEESVAGVRVVKGFGQEGRALEQLAGAADRLYGSRMRALRIQAWFSAALQAVPVVGQVAVLALGGWLALRGRISIGTFLAFSSYLLQLVPPVRMLSIFTVVAQQARAGAERIFEVLESTPVVVEREEAAPLPPVRGEIRFQDVTFGYLRSEPVLNGFTLTVAPGETVALVGPSGSGKSTVGLLVPRFYDVQEGTVRVDGTDVRDVTLDSLRQQVGVVFEETFLFSDTVRSNIAYGRPDATDEEVEAAARAAEAHEFILALPHGYATHLGEGGLTLSGGQRQRVALARALLTDPRILLLDDATSSVDARVEEEIHATLRRLLAGRTTVLVAHRRSTLQLADRIVVVDGGAVVDSGTHEELLGCSLVYRRMLGSSEEGDGELVADLRDGVLDSDDGVTAAAWRAPETVAAATAVAARPSAAPAVGGVTAGPPGAGGSSRNLALVAETPELRAAVEALPPPADHPDVDVAALATADAADAGLSLGRFLRPYRRPLAVGLALVVLDAAAGLAGPALVRVGLDRGVVEGSGRALALASAAFLGVALADWLVVRAQQVVIGRVAERLLFALRVRIFGHLQRLGLDFYEREMAGSVMTRITTDVEALAQLLQQGLVQAVVSLLTVVGVAVALAIMNVELALAALVALLPLAVATVWFRRRSAQAYRTARERVATVNATLQESVSGVRVAQAFAREDRNVESFRRVARRHLDARVDAQRLVATYFPFVELLSVLAAASVLGVGARLASAGSVSAGELVAFVLYLNLLFAPLYQLSQVFDSWQQASASLAKIRDLLSTEPSIRAPARPIDPGRLAGAIRFEDVRFRYAGATEDALAGVDLDVAPGQTVALVGETGAGKSTIVKLAARFYDPTEGRVLVDGHPLTDLEPTAYRRQLGYVPQEPFLFSGTVRDNIAYARPDASDAEVEAAARAVGAHEFVARLPGGYRQPLTERGRSLAAGQRQLLALARARLVDPAILLLDEATAALDMSTEARVVRAIGALAAPRTTLVIAHRLQTARAADRIVVVDGGRIVEQGAHDELVALGGHYARLWQAFLSEARTASGQQAG